MLRIIGVIIAVIALLYIFIGSLLYFRQRNMIYFPPPEIDDPSVESFRLTSGTESIKVWRLNPGKEKAVIYFGGNAENVWYTLPLFQAVTPNHTVYLLNYRGYGGSSGQPDEQGLYTDADTLYRYVADRHEQVVAVGRSLGGALAVHIAARQNLDKLVLITPFDSMANVAAGHYPRFPVKLLLKDHFDSSAIADKVTEPTLVLMAEGDEIVPHANTERLINRIRSSNIQVRSIPGTDHNDISRVEAYFDYLNEFIEQ